MEIVCKILWTETAINQLKDIFDYHSVKASPDIAQSLIQKLINSTTILEHSPLAGRNEEILRNRIQDFKFLIKGKYKIIYWLDHKFMVIHISSVFDTRQNPEKIKKLK